MSYLKLLLSISMAKKISLLLWNAQSIKSKIIKTFDFVNFLNIELFAITETWQIAFSPSIKYTETSEKALGGRFCNLR